MNEQELRQAMRATMAHAPVPPPMNETLVLDAARRAERRRRARWAGLGSGVAAAAIVALAVVVVATTSGVGGSAVVGSGGGQTSTTSTTTSDQSSTGSSTGSGEGTEPEFPDGQTDATARSGPRYETGLSLLDSMFDVVPSGYEAPDDLTYTDPGYEGGPLDSSQAAWDGKVNGVDVWDYLAMVPVTKGNGVGEFLVEVTTPGNELTGDGCDLPNLWGAEGTCTERTVDGKRVGLWTGKPAGPAADLCAVYRYDDGTVVWVNQSVGYEGSGKPDLTARPFSAEQLAELATDDRFHLD